MKEHLDIKAWLRAGSLPESAEFYRTFAEEDGRFIATEGATWDFKDQWPFSYSDAYFGGICRLACAFANTAGGVVIFGVDDKKRTGGHNKVIPNVDRFLQAFRQLTDRTLVCEQRSYNNLKYGAIDVLLILPRSSGTPPIVFNTRIGPYLVD